MADLPLPLDTPHGEAEFHITDLCRMVESRFSGAEVQRVYQAYLLAAEAHDGQRRQSGEPYITHPLAVARIVADDMRMDAHAIMAALLHDVLEDTPVTYLQLAEQFGDEVARLVEGLSKLTNLEGSKAEAQAENFRKMLLAMVSDIRVIVIKLADRLHNMRTLGAVGLAKRRRIARETLEVFAPIAHRLGITSIKNELEDRGFAALYPHRYNTLRAAVEKARGNRSELVSKIEIQSRAVLEEMGLNADVFGREKHLYSLFLKMRNKQMSFGDVYDMFAIRVIVDTVDDCYRALGRLHNLYKPVERSFKDHIAIPKNNGYQSLHTVMQTNTGVPVEAQIRTRDMDRMAQDGIAAHWKYKTGERDTPTHAQEWLQQVLELQKSASDTLDFYESAKHDLVHKEIYVFSPKGRIFRLPMNATPVDFAYAVHSDIGNQCRAARVDRRMMPLSTQLSSGQTVEIYTHEFASPSPMWLDFVVTARARHAIRHYLRTMDDEKALLFGRRLIMRALAALGGALDAVSDDNLQRVLRKFNHSDLDALLLNLGIGNHIPSDIAAQLLGEDTDPAPAQQQTTPLLVDGPEGSVVSMARCCLPIPGDNIQGVISAGHGVVVHRAGCRNVLKRSRNRSSDWVPVQWSTHTTAEFTTHLWVAMRNQPGSLARVADTISRLTANIENISFSNSHDSLTDIQFTLTVRDRKHMARLIRQIRNLRVVERVRREPLS
ncbi:MAG: bifunctional (p)ppGpp synthetase/guanosine-3',5'-bis(diphosphate) 3'-pyrophosphohydrolase [Pseudomonadota bacterium]